MIHHPAEMVRRGFKSCSRLTVQRHMKMDSPLIRLRRTVRIFRIQSEVEVLVTPEIPGRRAGHDLMKMGIEQGPIYKKLLDAVREAQLEGKVKTVKDARELVIKTLKSEAEA